MGLYIVGPVLGCAVLWSHGINIYGLCVRDMLCCAVCNQAMYSLFGSVAKRYLSRLATKTRERSSNVRRAYNIQLSAAHSSYSSSSTHKIYIYISDECRNQTTAARYNIQVCAMPLLWRDSSRHIIYIRPGNTSSSVSLFSFTFAAGPLGSNISCCNLKNSRYIGYIILLAALIVIYRTFFGIVMGIYCWGHRPISIK